ncbi:MAG TPA: LysE family translocator [Chloroflexia bacterium]|nr:LysE family translocator [Chloroflexia bacterium]
MQSFGVFMLATLALNLTPGPDMLYVLGRSVGQGRRAGVVSALGIGAGILVHMAAVALGLSALLREVPAAYEAIRYAGAAYLLYLGVRTWLERGTVGHERGEAPVPLWAVFRQGVVTNVLNPKVALFFLAFLPQFVDPARGEVGRQIVVLGLAFDLSGTAVNIAVALAAGWLGDRLRRSAKWARAQRALTGGVFVALAVRLALPGEART